MTELPETLATLHQRVIQPLYGLLLALSSGTPIDTPERERCCAQITEALAAVREVIDLGLEHPAAETPVIDELGRACRLHPQLPIELHCDSDAILTPTLAALVRHFAGEALANVVRHAHPDLVQVLASEHDGALRIEVVNDGADGGRAGTGLGRRLLVAHAAHAGAAASFGPRAGDRWISLLVIPVAVLASRAPAAASRV